MVLAADEWVCDSSAHEFRVDLWGAMSVVCVVINYFSSRVLTNLVHTRLCPSFNCLPLVSRRQD